MKKNDLILICSVLMIAFIGIIILFFISDNTSETAVITIDGKEYKRLPLDENTTITIETEHGSNTLVINDGKVYISEASCPDKVCIKSGHASELKPIVCFPNGVVVSIEEK